MLLSQRVSNRRYSINLLASVSKHVQGVILPPVTLHPLCMYDLHWALWFQLREILIPQYPVFLSLCQKQLSKESQVSIISSNTCKCLHQILQIPHTLPKRGQWYQAMNTTKLSGISSMFCFFEKDLSHVKKLSLRNLQKCKYITVCNWVN